MSGPLLQEAPFTSSASNQVGFDLEKHVNSTHDNMVRFRVVDMDVCKYDMSLLVTLRSPIRCQVGLNMRQCRLWNESIGHTVGYGRTSALTCHLNGASTNAYSYIAWHLLKL